MLPFSAFSWIQQRNWTLLLEREKQGTGRVTKDASGSGGWMSDDERRKGMVLGTVLGIFLSYPFSPFYLRTCQNFGPTFSLSSHILSVCLPHYSFLCTPSCCITSPHFFIQIRMPRVWTQRGAVCDCFSLQIAFKVMAIFFLISLEKCVEVKNWEFLLKNYPVELSWN